MTGATGNLTPDDSEEPFVPAERREVDDSDERAAVTASQGSKAPAQSGDVGEPGGDLPHESGYGSEHGLSPNDPAYRMESRSRLSSADPGQPRDRDTSLGGDEASDREEHF